MGIIPQDLDHMRTALTLAQQAEAQGEVPVGALIVNQDNQVIACAHNQPIVSHNACAHAEIIAIAKAGAHQKNYRLLHTTLYVTLEPCAMCVGAMVHARINRLVFGAFDPKSGAVLSAIQLLNHPCLNHQILYDGGVLETECAHVLKNFFRKKR